MSQTIITKVVVGSRLHGLDTPDSDWDYRGVYISPLIEVLSPFKKQKTTSWIEGEEDNTSYELAYFCKMATKGNATILEVLFSDQIIETTPIAEKMRSNWLKFIDTNHFVNASRGYARNQWKKFYSFESDEFNGEERTAKFAVAFLRVMWQCEQFLLTGQFKCDISQSDLFPLLKKIKPLSATEVRPYLPEIMNAMTDMDARVTEAYSKSELVGLKPDLKWIEDFIYFSYLADNQARSEKSPVQEALDAYERGDITANELNKLIKKNQ